MKVALFHGLESLHISDKSEFLHNNFEQAYCPKMNYYDKDLYIRQLSFIKKYEFDLLIGSSMGGWFAYCLSLDIGIDTILFNPAFNRIKFTPMLGNNVVIQTIILGKNDNIVNPELSKEYMNNYGIGVFNIHEENIEHRIPIDIFEKYMKKYI